MPGSAPENPRQHPADLESFTASPRPNGGTGTSRHQAIAWRFDQNVEIDCFPNVVWFEQFVFFSCPFQNKSFFFEKAVYRFSASLQLKGINYIGRLVRTFCRFGFPFQRTSAERHVEVACPGTAHTQRSQGRVPGVEALVAPLPLEFFRADLQDHQTLLGALSSKPPRSSFPY